MGNRNCELSFFRSKEMWKFWLLFFVISFFAWVGFREVLGSGYEKTILPDRLRDGLVAFFMATMATLTRYLKKRFDLGYSLPKGYWVALVISHCCGLLASGIDGLSLLILLPFIIKNRCRQKPKLQPWQEEPSLAEKWR